jgi:hypothetical protein
MGNFRTIDRQTGFLLPLARLPPQTNEADAALFPLHGNHTAIIAGESGLDLAAKTE